MVELVKDTFELLEMEAAKKNITLTTDMEYDYPIMVNADRERIQQLLTNLIVNSVKYGKQDGTTEISIENLIKNYQNINDRTIIASRNWHKSEGINNFCKFIIKKV